MSFLGNLFGGSAPKINYMPPSFSGGGLSATFGGGGYNVGASGARSDAVGSLASTFGGLASETAGLRSTVAPGYSLFRQAGLSDINTQGQATLSNLKDNLASRRILGSSFASDAFSRANADIEKQRTDFIAQSYLSELDASNKLLQQQYQASTSQFKTVLDEMNLEAGIAADLTGKASTSLASVATAQAQLDAQNAAGIGKLFGSLLTAPASSIFGKGISSLGSSFGGFFGGDAAAAGEVGGEAAGIGLSGDAEALALLAL